MPCFGKSALISIALAAASWAQTNAGGRPVHDEAQRLARWKEVRMPFQQAGISARERQMVEKLVDACRLLDDLFWRQSDLGGLTLCRKTHEPTIRTLLRIMAGRWDVAGENRPFIGEMPMPRGHELYPHDLTRAQIGPDDRAAIYSSTTVVKWQNGRLVGVPYHQEYRSLLQAMAQALREAAALAPDAAFANYLCGCAPMPS